LWHEYGCGGTPIDLIEAKLPDELLPDKAGKWFLPLMVLVWVQGRNYGLKMATNILRSEGLVG